MTTFISTTEAARKLGVSRVTVFNKIKSGEISAIKIGRNYAIPEEEVAANSLRAYDKGKLDEYVSKITDDYQETLQMLKDA